MNTLNKWLSQPVVITFASGMPGSIRGKLGMDESRKSGSSLAVLAVLLLAVILVAMLGVGGLVAYRMLGPAQYITSPDWVLEEDVVLIEDPTGAAIEEPKSDGMSTAPDEKPADAPND